MNVVEKKLSDLRPYENNPRFNEDAVPVVEESIRQFGFKVPIVVDMEGVIVAGHTRVEAAKRLGMESVPCVVADDLTPEQVRAFRLVDNKSAEFSGWDFDILDGELESLGESFDLSKMGFPDLSADSAALAAAMDANSVTESGAEDADEKEKYLLHLKMPVKFKKRIEGWRKKNGDTAIEDAVLSVCGIEKEG